MSKPSSDVATCNKEIDRLKRELEKCTLEKHQLQAQVDAIRHIVSVKPSAVPDEKAQFQEASSTRSTSSPAPQEPTQGSQTPSKGQSKKKKNRSNRKPKAPSPRNQTSLLSLPEELIDEIVWHLTPIQDMQYIGVKTPWQGDKLLDSWNKDVDNLSKTCHTLREGLMARHKKRVVTIEDDFQDLQAKVNAMSVRDRVRATGLVIYRNRKAFDLGGRTDYRPLLNAFPRLRAIKHYGQTRPLRLPTGFSTWNIPFPLQVLDIFHSSSLFEEKLLPPGVEPTSVDTLILRDGYNEPTAMLYDEAAPILNATSRLGHVTYLARHFKNVRNLVLHLAIKDCSNEDEDDFYDDTEDEDDTLEREKTPLRLLLRDDFPLLQSIEFRFRVPYAYGNRDICLLDGFRDLFKRFNPEIKHVRFFLRLEEPRMTSQKDFNLRMRMTLPSESTYWDIIRTHYLPTAKRLEDSLREIAQSLPSLETFEFRVDDAEEHPDVPENPTPLVRFKATVDPLKSGQKVTVNREYHYRIPEGSPEVEGFEDQGYNGF